MKTKRKKPRKSKRKQIPTPKSEVIVREDETPDDMNTIARKSLTKSQLAIFEYAAHSYERLGGLVKTRKDLEEQMFSPEALAKAISEDPAALIDRWKLVDGAVGDSVKNLQEINRMAQGYELIKEMLDRFSPKQAKQNTEIIENSELIKDMLEHKFKEIFQPPTTVIAR